MAHWTSKYFGSLYHEIYSRFFLDKQRSLDEAAFASHVLNLGRRTVLDLACGYGRHAQLLASSNRVIALDNNREYLQVAQAEAKPRIANNLRCLQADMRALPLHDKSVDAAILLFNSFGYFDAPDAADLTRDSSSRPTGQVWRLPNVFYERQLVDPAFGRFRDPEMDPAPQATAAATQAAAERENFHVLQEILRVLKPGGGLLLEIANSRQLLQAVEEAPRRLLVMDDCEIHEEFEWNPRESRLYNRTRFILGDREESGVYSLRIYEPAEIKGLLKEAGFILRRSFGDYEGNRFRPAQSDVFLIHASRPARSSRA